MSKKVIAKNDYDRIHDLILETSRIDANDLQDRIELIYKLEQIGFDLKDALCLYDLECDSADDALDTFLEDLVDKSYESWCKGKDIDNSIDYPGDTKFMSGFATFVTKKAKSVDEITQWLEDRFAKTAKK